MKTNWFVGSFIVFAIATLLLAMSCGSDPAPQPNRNRVPQMSDYVQQAQQSAKDAQAAADKATQAQKDIDASIAKLNGVQHDSNGEPKEGRPEATLAGNIVEFSVTDSLSFLFVEKSGFAKKLHPVCDGQTLPGNKTIVLLYHWQSWHDQQHTGCFVIDGFNIVQ